MKCKKTECSAQATYRIAINTTKISNKKVIGDYENGCLKFPRNLRNKSGVGYIPVCDEHLPNVTLGEWKAMGANIKPLTNESDNNAPC